MKDNSNLISKPKLPIGWVRRMMEGVHTQEEWIKLIKGLPDIEQVRFLLASQPKELKVESDTTISLIINGIKQVKAIDNTPIAALDQHIGQHIGQDDK